MLILSDFISIGTNDLIQYVMAASREKREVSDYYNAGYNILLPFLREIIAKAVVQGKECSICGEIAGNQTLIESLLDIKLTHFSVQPARIPEIKNKIYHILKARV